MFGFGPSMMEMLLVYSTTSGKLHNPKKLVKWAESVVNEFKMYEKKCKDKMDQLREDFKKREDRMRKSEEYLMLKEENADLCRARSEGVYNNNMDALNKKLDENERKISKLKKKYKVSE